MRSVRRGFAAKVLLVLGMLLLVGCSASGSRTEIRLGYGAGEPDLGDVADYLGLDSLQGKLSLKIQPLGSDSAAISALVAGQLDLVNVDLASAIQASQKDLPLKVLSVANAKQEFVFVTQGSIKNWPDLKGKTVAFHQPGSTTESYSYMVTEKNGLKRNEITWQSIQGSGNRVTAMLAKKIDATVLEWPDYLELRTKGDFTLMSTFNDVAPESIATAWITTDSWLAKHPNEAKEFLAGIVGGYKKAATDKDAFVKRAATLVKESNPEFVAQTHDFYVKIGMFPTANVLTEAAWQATDTYYREQAKQYETPAPYSMVAADLLADAWK